MYVYMYIYIYICICICALAGNPVRTAGSRSESLDLCWPDPLSRGVTILDERNCSEFDPRSADVPGRNSAPLSLSRSLARSLAHAPSRALTRPHSPRVLLPFSASPLASQFPSSAKADYSQCVVAVVRAVAYKYNAVVGVAVVAWFCFEARCATPCQATPHLSSPHHATPSYTITDHTAPDRAQRRERSFQGELRGSQGRGFEHRSTRGFEHVKN